MRDCNSITKETKTKLNRESLTKYKNQLLLKEACKLLCDGELCIGEIAENLGFCDIYAFSHFISKYTGVSPTVYKGRNN